MAETYRKVGDDLEVTTNCTRIVTELQLLEQKQRLQQDKIHAEANVTRIEAAIDELDNKLEVIHGEEL